MKKTLALGAAVLLLAGCAKTVKCTTKDKDADEKYTITGKFKKDNLQKYTYVIEYKDKDKAKTYCKRAKSTKEDNIKVKCSGKKITVTIKRPKDDKSKVTEKDFTNRFESSSMTCK